MRQRVMKLFLAFMVMTGLFSAGTAVKAEADGVVFGTPAVTYEDVNGASTAKVTIAITDNSEGQAYLTQLKADCINSELNGDIVELWQNEKGPVYGTEVSVSKDNELTFYVPSNENFDPKAEFTVTLHVSDLPSETITVNKGISNDETTGTDTPASNTPSDTSEPSNSKEDTGDSENNTIPEGTYTVRFVEGPWDDAKEIATRYTDINGRLVLSDPEDTEILTYDMDPDDLSDFAEGWAYRPERAQDIAYTMTEFQEGITLTGNTDFWPVKSRIISFYKSETDAEAYATAKTALIGNIPSDRIPEEPSDLSGKNRKFSSWYMLYGDGTKQYINTLDWYMFGSDTKLYADWYGEESKVTISPDSASFGELTEGYSNPEPVSFTIKNNGESSVKVSLECNGQYFWMENEYMQPFELNAQESKTVEVHFFNGVTVGDYSMPIKVVDAISEAPFASATVTATVKENPLNSACIIRPKTSDRTDSFEVTCPGTDIIQSISNDSLVSFGFDSEDGEGAGINPTPHRENDVLTVSAEQIEETGLYLNGKYRVTMSWDFNDHQDHMRVLLNKGEYVAMNTSHIVKKVIPDEVAEKKLGNRTGIIIRATSTQAGKDYIQAAYDWMRVPGPMNQQFTELELQRENEEGHLQVVSLQNDKNMGPLFEKIDEGVLFIPDTVLKFNNVANNTYGFTLRVPGYADYYVSYSDDSSDAQKRLVITCGAADPGKFYMAQNGDYSLTVKAGGYENGASNYDILKTAVKGFEWTYNGSSRGWTVSPDGLARLITYNDEAEAITIAYDPNDEGGLVNFYSYVYNYEHDISTMTLIAENYAPGIVYSLKNWGSRDIHFINPIRNTPVDLTAYLLGTKALIMTADKDYLAGMNRIELQQSRNGKGPGDWVMTAADWDFTDIRYNDATNQWEMSIPVTYEKLQKYTSKPLGEFMLLTRNIKYRDVYGGPTENFKAAAFLENAQNAGSENLDPDELADLDEDAETEFKHVQFEGTVTSVDDAVNINGSIAGAITPEDTDLYNGEVIDITTSITEMSEEDKKEIMDYLNGHHLGEIKHAVDISIVKKYPGQEPQVIPVLGVQTAIVFSDLPELQEGYEYIVITKHNGKIKLIPVTYKNGKLIAYTNEFSSFAITSRPKDSVIPDAEPSDSASGSSKKESSAPVKIDNVVTCQMAGYPAGYAWNESAKACQPGFLDNAGVFHSTAVRKAGVPNTYDKGLKGSFFSLMASIVMGIGAAWVLRNY